MPTPMDLHLADLGTRIARGDPVIVAPVPGGTPTPIPAPAPTTTPSTPETPTDPYAAPATAPTPTAAPTPATEPPLSPPLQNWLLHTRYGNDVLSREMYDYYNGDQILQAVRQYDPNAKWTLVPQYGGEGGMGADGYRLDFDFTKLPGVGGPGGGRPIFESGLVPANADLYNPNMVYNDPLYGTLTPQQNVRKQKDPWWTIAAPIAVGMLAPWAAGGLAAAGIGGTAGLTAGATGSGLAAGATSPWWATTAAKSIPAIGRTIAGPSMPTGWTPPVGTLPKPAASNESSLVATQFADDPYGFSKGA